MKKTVLFLLFSAFTGLMAFSQEKITPAESGVTYGAGTTNTKSIPAAELEKKMKDEKFQGKITGKVLEVCQERGCWMKVETTEGKSLMVKFKDYGFFMPQNIVGKKVVLEGEAIVKEVSVKQQQDYAQDAGKSEEEVKKITKAKKELQFIAAGVLVL